MLSSAWELVMVAILTSIARTLTTWWVVYGSCLGRIFFFFFFFHSKSCCGGVITELFVAIYFGTPLLRTSVVSFALCLHLFLRFYYACTCCTSCALLWRFVLSCRLRDAGLHRLQCELWFTSGLLSTSRTESISSRWSNDACPCSRTRLVSMPGRGHTCATRRDLLLGRRCSRCYRNC